MILPQYHHRHNEFHGTSTQFSLAERQCGVNSRRHQLYTIHHSRLLPVVEKGTHKPTFARNIFHKYQLFSLTVSLFPQNRLFTIHLSLQYALMRYSNRMGANP